MVGYFRKRRSIFCKTDLVIAILNIEVILLKNESCDAYSDWPIIGIGIGPIFALLVDNQNQ
jgi:hypothetical protein